MTIDHWTRRKFIRNTAATAAALRLAANALPLRASAPPLCILNQEQEEGPYYVDREVLRPDITEGKPGVPLRLRITIIDAKTCQPIPNAALDIWHCDASGIYSGYTAFDPAGPSGPGRPGGPAPDQSGEDNRMPPPPPDAGNARPPMGRPPKMQPSDKQVFLRGVQLADAQGLVEFTTIYPGHYMGRVNHIHMKVHIGGNAAVPEYQGGHVSHTGQIFFPEEISKLVTETQPYAAHKIHRTTMEEDGVFNGEHGSESIATLTQVAPGELSSGYIATLTLGVDPRATPTAADRRPPNRN